MSQDHPSISEHDLPAAARRVFWFVLLGAILAGGAAGWYYASQQLALSHYDARAHLVVARRVFDSLTPGWRQLGSVWLPLPHLLNLLPTALDWSYRTGAISIAISIGALALGLAAVAKRLVLQTGSVAAACVVPAVVLANPNVLYLQSTPMTEPLLFGLTLLAVAAADAWLSDRSASNATSLAAFLSCMVLTRYEGWLIAGALLVVTLLAKARIADLCRVWVPPAIAIAAFLGASLAATGQWPLSESFFVPDFDMRNRPGVVLEKMLAGTLDLAGWPLVAVGLAGLAIVVVRSLSASRWLLFAVPVAAAALPFIAFHAGHPFRVRYLVPLLVAAGLLCAIAVTVLPRRLRFAGAVLLVLAVTWGRNPLDRNAPMLLEAQWETPFRQAREAVTAALLARDDGSPILASMGSLAHYMHETAKAGLPLQRFLHEGNGDLWTEALLNPSRSVRWILIEERAEGGDMLAARARDDSGFLDGFDRVIEAGGLALYERRR